MTDYVMCYDICAFMLMCIFLAYYLSCKRFESISNKMFVKLSFLVFASISFDILSVLTLRYRAVLPVWLNYFTNIAYFEITGTMAVYYCMYTLGQTRSFFNKRYVATALFLFPYVSFASLILTTPWTHLAFYFDPDKNYHHGPLMNMMLIVVIIYLGFSMFRITFCHDNVTLRKRIPYYIFALCMAVSILIQALLKVYLMYGIAEAMGIIILYIAEHNPNDLLDTMTDLFNRKAMIIKLHDMEAKKETCSIIAFGVRDYYGGNNDSPNIYRSYILEQIGQFINSNFDSEYSYYIDNSSFAIICPEGQEQAIKTVQKIRKRFKESWRFKGGDAKIRIGLAEARVPKDYTSPSELLNLIHSCISYSYIQGSTVVRAEDIRDVRENKIKELESQQKELEKKYLDSESKMIEAVNADRSKTMFLAQMSHEIRTPMTAILGMTELLMRDTKDPKVIEHANAIMSSGKTLIGIINDILDFSKIESGKFELVCEDYVLKSSVIEVINSIEQRVSDKRLDFKMYFDPKLPSKMHGDPIRIRQIVSNLMTNACKYTEKGGISLTIREKERSDDNVYIEIVVSDTGIGITEENMSKLFDGFVRLDMEKNKAIEGTGLGLAICKQLVDTMNGTIEVKSTYGVGSTFTVTIPQTIVDGQNAIEIKNAKKLHFLAYYRTESELDGYRSTFSDFGIETEYVSTGEEFDRVLAEGNERFTHIFITYGEFERRISSADKIVKDPRLIIAIYYRQYMVNLSGYNVIHMPINSIFLNNVLSGETVFENYTGNTGSNNYIAPDINILAVDDNLVNLRIFAGLLDCHKMNIDTVDSGDKCISFTQKKKYDLIFLDHMMPKKDGIETLNEMLLDANNLNKTTPVIAFTANAISGMKEMFMEHGFSDFLSKPIDISKMEAILHNYLPSEKLIPISVKTDDADSKALASNGVVITERTFEEKPKDGSFVIAGIDMENALYYTGGSYDTLKSVLEVFVEDGHKKQPLLEQYIKQSDYENYRIEIHAVKSLCKGIGAGELSEKARLLEMAAKDNDIAYIKANWQEAYDQYGKLIDNIESSLNEINSADTESTEASVNKEFVLEFKEQLTCVVALLHEFEEDIAVKLIDDLASKEMEDGLKQNIKEVQKLLSVFDYEGAEAKITEVLNED